MFEIDSSPLFVEECYKKADYKLSLLTKKITRPLTLAEKILFSHVASPERFQEGEFLNLMPDRVLMQDVTAQMALLQFMLTQKASTAVPTSIHCDPDFRILVRGIQ